MDGPYNEIMLIKLIEKQSVQGYALLTVENRKDVITCTQAPCLVLLTDSI